MGTKSRKDLLNELLKPKKGAKAADAGLSMRELMAASGLSIELLRQKLQVLKAAGMLVCVRKIEEALDGRPVSIPTYKLKS